MNVTTRITAAPTIEPRMKDAASSELEGPPVVTTMTPAIAIRIPNAPETIPISE
jgi:hypothetical protein